MKELKHVSEKYELKYEYIFSYADECTLKEANMGGLPPTWVIQKRQLGMSAEKKSYMDAGE